MQASIAWDALFGSEFDFQDETSPHGYDAAFLDILGVQDASYSLPALLPLEDFTRSTSAAAAPSVSISLASKTMRTKTSTASKTAQQKYRDRQKVRLQDSEEQIAALELELHTMRIQQEGLAMRNSLLEKLLDTPVPVAAAAPAAAMDGAPPPLPAPPVGAEHSWWLDATTRRLWEDMLGIGPTVTFTLGPGPPVTLAREQVEEMPQEIYMSLAHRYVSALGNLLLEARPDDTTSTAYRRLEQLVLETWRLHTVVGMKYPAKHKAVHTAPAGPGSSPDPQPAHLLLAVHLQPVQVKTLLGLRCVYLKNQGQTAARRAALTDAVQRGTMRDIASVDELVAAAEELQQAICQEHCLMIKFIIGCWRQVMSPFQAATLMLQAHPRKADLFSMAEALAAERGEPDCAALLAEGAAAAEGSLPTIDGVLAMLQKCSGGEAGSMSHCGESQLPGGCLVAALQRREAAAATA